MDAVRYFLCLQIKMIHRSIRDWGISPLLAYAAIPVLFVVGSIVLFAHTEYAPWIYMGFAAMTLAQLGGAERQRVIYIVFQRRMRWRVRALENLLFISPFVAFLLYERKAWFAIGLLAVAMLAIPIRIGNAATNVLPTPFSSRPFEFTIGFRTYVWILLGAYLLMVVGVYVTNGNLSIAALVLMMLVCANYYGWSEPVWYVWVYALAPNAFLWIKVNTAFRYFTVLLLPMVIVTAVSFPSHLLTILVVMAVGYGYLAMAVLAKYSALPGNISVPQGIFMVLSLVLPPLLLVSIPYFYRKALNNMMLIL